MKIQRNINIAILEAELRMFDIKCFSVALPPHISDKNSVAFTDHKEFARFLVNENIKSLFVMSHPLSIEDYYITDDTVEDLVGEHAAQNLSKAVERAIVSYNLSIEQLKQKYEEQLIELKQKYEEQLIELKQNLYFTVYNGFMVYIILADKIDLADPHEQLELILAENEAEIENEKKQRKLLIEMLQEKLKQKILEDSDFYKCTNINLRRNYAYKLWEKLDKEFEPLKKYWQLPPNLTLFVDAI